MWKIVAAMPFGYTNTLLGSNFILLTAPPYSYMYATYRPTSYQKLREISYIYLCESRIVVLIQLHFFLDFECYVEYCYLCWSGYPTSCYECEDDYVITEDWLCVYGKKYYPIQNIGIYSNQIVWPMHPHMIISTFIWPLDICFDVKMMP